MAPVLATPNPRDPSSARTRGQRTMRMEQRPRLSKSRANRRSFGSRLSGSCTMNRIWALSGYLVRSAASRRAKSSGCAATWLTSRRSRTPPPRLPSTSADTPERPRHVRCGCPWTRSPEPLILGPHAARRPPRGLAVRASMVRAHAGLIVAVRPPRNARPRSHRRGRALARDRRPSASPATSLAWSRTPWKAG